MKLDLFLALPIIAPLLLFCTASRAGTPSADQPVKVAEGCEFPEGPAWDGKGKVYFSNCNSDYVSTVDLAGKVEKKWMSAGESGTDSFQKTNGMAFHKDGSLYVCDFGRGAVVRIHPDKKSTVVAQKFDGKPIDKPNDLAFHRNGSLYFTCPKFKKDDPTDWVYRLSTNTGVLTRVAGNMSSPNGLAFSPDGRWLYVCESQKNRIVRFAVKGDGTLGALEAFIDLSFDGAGDPDGMAIDSKGNLWITHYGRHTVLICSSEGKHLKTIALPHTQDGGPTNIEFAGKDLKTVYITDPGDNCVWKMTSDVPGAKLFESP